MKNWILIALLGSLLACKKTNTKNELIAIQKIEASYNGNCAILREEKKNPFKKDKYVQLQVKGSKLIASLAQKSKIPASHIAYIYFSTAPEDARAYEFVKVHMLLDKNKFSEYDFQTSELAAVSDYIPILEDVKEDLKTNNYSQLHTKFDLSKPGQVNEERMKQFCMSYDSTYGTIDSLQFRGFEFFKDDVNKLQVLRLCGQLYRKKENTAITIFINKISKKILSLKFSL